jgi:hypothetical protein
MRPVFRTQHLSHNRGTNLRKFTDAHGAYEELSDPFINDNSGLSLSSVNARRSSCRPGISKNTSSLVQTREFELSLFVHLVVM